MEKITYKRTRPIEDWTDKQIDNLKQDYLRMTGDETARRHPLKTQQIRNIAALNNWRKQCKHTLTSTETEKECKSCGETKPVCGDPKVSQFNRLREGYQSYCRDCAKKRISKYASAYANKDKAAKPKRKVVTTPDRPPYSEWESLKARKLLNLNHHNQLV